jgi:hypothetical protein
VAYSHTTTLSNTNTILCAPQICVPEAVSKLYGLSLPIFNTRHASQYILCKCTCFVTHLVLLKPYSKFFCPPHAYVAYSHTTTLSNTNTILCAPQICVPEAVSKLYGLSLPIFNTRHASQYILCKCTCFVTHLVLLKPYSKFCFALCTHAWPTTLFFIVRLHEGTHMKATPLCSSVSDRQLEQIQKYVCKGNWLQNEAKRTDWG